MDVAGIRTTHGSRIYAENVATADSVIAGRLRGAGAVFVGKTNVPEFGIGSHTFNEVWGPTRNPYALDRSAGGSSGGAAAAVTSGMLPVADGSDLGGSIRNPASFGNLVGLRPTAGRVASARPGDAWDPGSVLGPLARTVSDAAMLLSVISGPERRAPLSIDEDPTQFLALRRVRSRGRASRTARISAASLSIRRCARRRRPPRAWRRISAPRSSPSRSTSPRPTSCSRRSARSSSWKDTGRMRRAIPSSSNRP